MRTQYCRYAVLTDLRKSVVNVFVVSLCVNDICSLVLVVDLIVDSYISRSWRSGPLLCRLNPELTVAFTGCTLWHTALIAVHRYLVVIHPQAYKRLSKRAYTVFVLVAARAIPFACCLPGLIHLDERSDVTPVGYVPKLLRCVLPSDDRRRIMIVTTVLTVVPCAVVVLCYMAVLFSVGLAAFRLHHRSGSTARRSGAGGSNGSSQSQHQSRHRRELRVLAIFGAIFLVVLGGFTPYTVVRSIDRHYQFDADVYVAVSVFYGVATCSSPLVYGALSTQIRQACREVLTDCIRFVSPAGSHGITSIGMSATGRGDNKKLPEIVVVKASTSLVGGGRTTSVGAVSIYDSGAQVVVPDNTANGFEPVTATIELNDLVISTTENGQQRCVLANTKNDVTGYLL